MKSFALTAALAIAFASTALYLSGCSGNTQTSSKPNGKTPAGKAQSNAKAPADGKAKPTEHSQKEGHHEEEEHGGALADKDVKMPASFKDGVGRLKQQLDKIDQLIKNNELDSVHHAAEEMALVARKMKELAAKDIPEDNRVEAGRLCNEVAGYFKPIDEAADAHKKPETVAIRDKMAAAISQLEQLAK